MARKLGILCLAWLVLNLLGACAQPAAPCPTPEPPRPVTDLGGREVVCAVINTYPPFSYLGPDNQPIGFDYDLETEVCKRANCKPKWKEVAWQGIFEAARAGEFDVAFQGTTMTLERSKIVDFSDPIIEYGQAVLVRADDTSIPDEEALVKAVNKKIGTEAGTTNEITAIKKFGEQRVMLYDSSEIPIQALLSGDVDAVLIDEIAGLGYMRANPGKMKMPFKVSSGEFLAFFFTPGSPLEPAFNQAINQMWADGTMQALMDKWFSAQ